jgi:hypothetical protein
MKTQYKRPNAGRIGEGCASAPADRLAVASVLDTYKQLLQPNIHAGFQRFKG